MRVLLSATVVSLTSLACGQHPSNPVGPSPLAVTEPAAATSIETPLKLNPSDRCDYPDLRVVVLRTEPGTATFSGSFDGTHKGGTMSGSATVTMAPLSDARMISQQHAYQLPDGVFAAEGDATLTAIHGSTSYHLRDRLTITGGTRLFQGATGELRADGTYDPVNGTMIYTLRGRLCRTGTGGIDPVE
jgi:hypothetical protein